MGFGLGQVLFIWILLNFLVSSLLSRALEFFLACLCRSVFLRIVSLVKVLFFGDACYACLAGSRGVRFLGVKIIKIVVVCEHSEWFVVLCFVLWAPYHDYYVKGLCLHDVFVIQGQSRRRISTGVVSYCCSL